MKNNGGGLSVNLCVCESPCVRVYFARSHRNQKAKNCIQFFFASQVQNKRSAIIISCRDELLFVVIIIIIFPTRDGDECTIHFTRINVHWEILLQFTHHRVAHTRRTPLPAMIFLGDGRDGMLSARALSYTRNIQITIGYFLIRVILFFFFFVSAAFAAVSVAVNI